MKWILIALALLVALALIVVAVGFLLPKQHVAARTARFKESPEELWRVITDVAAFPSWRDLKSVEVVERPGGHRTWREVDNHGQTILFETVEESSPRRLVSRIADPSLPFGGTWTYAITALPGGGSQMTITENGEVRNPVYRFISRLIIGHHATMEVFLRSLGRKFGEEVAFTEAT
jgi:uncharacterized protein YndB with AHSA1/START domain